MEPKNYLININYYRYYGDYDGWNLWCWKNGLDNGMRIDFDHGTEEFKTASFYIEINNFDETLGFILRKTTENSEWIEKDISFDRFIPLNIANSNGVINIYLKQGEIDIGFDEFHFDCFSKKSSCSINEAINSAINNAIHESMNNEFEVNLSPENIESEIDFYDHSERFSNIDSDSLEDFDISSSNDKFIDDFDDDVLINFETTLEVSDSESDEESDDNEDVIINFQTNLESSTDDVDTELLQSIDSIMEESFNRQLSKLNLLKLALRTNITNEDVISDAKRINKEEPETIAEPSEKNVNIFRYLHFKFNNLFNGMKKIEQPNKNKGLFIKLISNFKAKNDVEIDITEDKFGKLPCKNKKVFGFFINGNAEKDICNSLVFILNTDNKDVPFKLPSNISEWSILMDDESDCLESIKGDYFTVKANSTAILGDTKGIKTFEKRIEDRIRKIKEGLALKRKELKKKELKRNVEVSRSVQQEINKENIKTLNKDKIAL
jgi:hypothetical protein